MPLIFPSHQGLILPLWRRFPDRIDAVALCAGAALPDIADAIAWPFRGELGQWLGHSLLGVVLAAPLGVLLARIARRALPRRALARLDPAPPQGGARSLAREALSVLAGALSHLLFDLVTHGNSLLLFPWYQDDRLFPSWWYHAWGAIPLPVYRRPYPIAPHTVSWLLLSAAGAALFFRCLRPRVTGAGPSPGGIGSDGSGGET